MMPNHVRPLNPIFIAEYRRIIFRCILKCFAKLRRTSQSKQLIVPVAKISLRAENASLPRDVRLVFTLAVLDERSVIQLGHRLA